MDVWVAVAGTTFTGSGNLHVTGILANPEDIISRADTAAITSDVHYQINRIVITVAVTAG